jgi:hypothetical protein
MDCSCRCCRIRCRPLGIPEKVIYGIQLSNGGVLIAHRLIFNSEHDMSTIAKTSNAAYKQYKSTGVTLSFTEFLHREKEKMFSANGQDDSLLLVNKSLNDTVQTAIRDTLKQGGLKEQETGKTFFGINKFVLIGAGVAIIGGTVWLVLKKR